MEYSTRRSTKRCIGHKVNETSYRRKLKIYIKAYLEFVYASPSVILEVSFGGSYMDQFKVVIRGEAHEVHSMFSA